MKTLKFKLWLLSLTSLLAVSFFFTSCEHETLDLPTTPELMVEDLTSFENSKNLEILSENGLSKIIIKAGSNDQSLLDEIKQSDFKIVPIFEAPVEDLNLPDENNLIDDETSTISEVPESSMEATSLEISVVRAELEEGAIGYEIQDNSRADHSRSSGIGDFYSSCNNVRIKRYQNKCSRLEVWKKQYSSSNYSYKRNSNCCANQTTSYYGGNSYRLKAKVSYGSNPRSSWRIYFWN